MLLERVRKTPELSPMDWRNTTSEELLNRIEIANVVGMGGAGFPTHQKIRIAMNREFQIVIGNGIECDPGVSADEALMVNYPHDVLEGLEIVAQCISADKMFLPTKSERSHATLLSVVPSNIDIRLLPSNASEGEERVLIRRLTGIDVGMDSYPATRGIAVLNVATLFAICEAVRDGRVPHDRIMTVGKEDSWVRFDTPIGELLGTSESVRLGGPITGEIASADSRTGPKTNAATIQTKSVAAPCIRCGWCNDVCPRELPVLHLYLHALHDKLAPNMADEFALCHECGACAVACPSQIQLVDYLRNGKHATIAAVESLADASDASNRYDRHLKRAEKRDTQSETERIARLQKSRNW